MYGGFQWGPQLGPPDAERRQSLGQQMLDRAIVQQHGFETLPTSQQYGIEGLRWALNGQLIIFLNGIGFHLKFFL